MSVHVAMGYDQPHDIYRRYWDYYSRVMKWKRHYRTNFAAKMLIRRRQHQMNSLSGERTGGTSECHRSMNVVTGDRQSPCGPDVEPNYSSNVPSCRTAQSPAHSSQNNFADEESEPHSNDDDLVFEMEVSEEMLLFLEKTDQHRRQLKAQREAAAMNVDKHNTNEVEQGPPSERQGARRTAEMKRLYGKQAATIHGMETAVQLNFHRNCDYSRPRLWPNMPIKLPFK